MNLRDNINAYDYFLCDTSEFSPCKNCFGRYFYLEVGTNLPDNSTGIVTPFMMVASRILYNMKSAMSIALGGILGSATRNRLNKSNAKRCVGGHRLLLDISTWRTTPFRVERRTWNTL